MKKLSHKHILFETVGHQLPSSLHFHYKLFKITSPYLPILQAPPACFYHLITLIIISDHPYRNSDNNNSAKHDYTKMPNQSNVTKSDLEFFLRLSPHQHLPLQCGQGLLRGTGGQLGTGGGAQGSQPHPPQPRQLTPLGASHPSHPLLGWMIH